MQIMDVHWPYRVQKFSLNPAWQFENHQDQKKVTPRLTSESPQFTPQEHKSLIAQYQNAVRRVDSFLGDFIASLKSEGRLDDTVVIITADHGEEFHEHGHYFHSSNLFDILVHVL
jgi:membrane-anchored protein YejM (alkaline phosphatase superfamily)